MYLEQYNVLASLPDAMMIIGGLVMILVLLVILRSVHRQAEQIAELQREVEASDREEVIANKEQQNG